MPPEEQTIEQKITVEITKLKQLRDKNDKEIEKLEKLLSSVEQLGEGINYLKTFILTSNNVFHFYVTAAPRSLSVSKHCSKSCSMLHGRVREVKEDEINLPNCKICCKNM